MDDGTRDEVTQWRNSLLEKRKRVLFQHRNGVIADDEMLEETAQIDGRQSVSANVKVTTAMTNEKCCGANLGDQYGDYGGIDAYGGAAYPFWTDRRVGGSVDGYEEAYTAAVTAK